MDFDFTEAQQAFRQEIRARVEKNVPEDLRGRGFASSRGEPEAVARLRGWQRTLHKAGYVGMDWPPEYGGRGASLGGEVMSYGGVGQGRAAGVRRPRRLAGRAGHALRGDGAGAGAPAAEPERALDGGAPADERRGRPAEGPASRQDPHRRGDLVPGLLGAERGQRPRQPPDPRRARWRLVRAERPEGLDEI